MDSLIVARKALIYNVVYNVGVALLFLLASCAATETGPFPIPHSNEMPVPPPIVAPLLLDPGTAVEVKFHYTPEINEIQTVTPDGKITLQLVGEVEVAGKTTQQVHDELVERFRQWLVDPELVVIVRSSPTRQILVSGYVNEPGVFEMPGNMSVLQALMLAGGADFTVADVSQVVVLRQDPEQLRGYLVDLEPALQGKPHTPFQLAPMDMVFVPQTGIASANQWVEQYITNMFPDLGFFFRYPIGAGTIGWGVTR